MNITEQQADRLKELQELIADSLFEFKNICRHTMTPNEYQQFKYRTLGHIEPTISEETEWVTTYSSIDSLEKVAANAADNLIKEEEND